MNKHLLLALAFVGFAAQSQAQEPVTFKEAPFTYKQIGTNKVEVSKVDKAYASGTPVTDYVVPATVENGGVTYTVPPLAKLPLNGKMLQASRCLKPSIPFVPTPSTRLRCPR